MGGKCLALWRTTRRHDDGPWLLQGLWQTVTILDAVEPALIIKALAADEPAENLKPLVALIVPRLMVDHIHTEHVEFVLVPSADDVEAHAAMADMIDGRDRLGGEYRVNQWNVNRHKDAGVPGQGGERRALGQRLV